MSLEFLDCLARAVVKNAARALERNEPLGDSVCDVAHDTLKEWKPLLPDPERQRATLEALAGSTAAAAHQLAEQAADFAPPPLRKPLTAYLEQVPETIRRAFVHPANPTGLAMPPQFRTREPGDLLRFLPLRAPRFQPGDRPLPLVDWVLERLLGIGGFGEVWKAIGSNAGPVALKFCFATDASEVLRHEKAVLDQIGAKGGHPGIVRLLRAHLDVDPPCLEYEYVEGIDLGRQIREWPAERPADRVRPSLELLRELVDVVAFMHRMTPPVVHRDLKPANVLLQATALGRVVRVTDFGIGGVATRLARGHTQTARSFEANMLTRLSGAFTAVYASPQQLRAEKPDPGDDVHALGVIWYQMLTGDLHAQMVPPDWKEILKAAAVPPDVIDVLRQCLASNLRRRLPNAVRLAEELRTLVPTPQATFFRQVCPSCEHAVLIRDWKNIGRKIECPKCKYRFVVEEPSDDESDEPSEFELTLEDSGELSSVELAEVAGDEGTGDETECAPLSDYVDEDEVDRPAPKKKKGGTSPILFIGICLVVVSVIGLGIALVLMLDQPRKQQLEQTANSSK